MNLNRAEWDRLYRYCLALCGQPADAEDLLHNALERYLKACAQNIQCPQAWMRRVARNLFLDQQRRLQRLPFESLEFPDEMQDQGPSLEAGLIDQRRLEAVWGSLNPAEREVVFLWAAEGLSASEIALQLGEPRGTILSRLHRLRSKLSLSQPATSSTCLQGDA